MERLESLVREIMVEYPEWPVRESVEEECGFGDWCENPVPDDHRDELFEEIIEILEEYEHEDLTPDDYVIEGYDHVIEKHWRYEIGHLLVSVIESMEIPSLARECKIVIRNMNNNETVSINRNEVFGGYSIYGSADSDALDIVFEQSILSQESGQA